MNKIGNIEVKVTPHFTLNYERCRDLYYASEEDILEQLKEDNDQRDGERVPRLSLV